MALLSSFTSELAKRQRSQRDGSFDEFIDNREDSARLQQPYPNLPLVKGKEILLMPLRVKTNIAATRRGIK
jgi:hypothetical protein